MNGYKLLFRNVWQRKAISKFLFILLFLFTCNVTYAQLHRYDTLIVKAAMQKYSNDLTWLQVYIKPLSLIDLQTGTMQIGTEKKLNNHFAISVDYGLHFTALSYGSK